MSLVSSNPQSAGEPKKYAVLEDIGDDTYRDERQAREVMFALNDAVGYPRYRLYEIREVGRE